VSTHDVIVIGAGGMGTAAAAHLARRGVRVLALDRFPVAHARGSSHGQTRLIRLAYFEHPDYVPLLRRARELWIELDGEAGGGVHAAVGLVTLGPAESAVIRGTLVSAGEHGIDVERLSAAERRRRWPALVAPDDWATLFEPGAGWLRVEACVRGHAALAERHGAEVRGDEEVRGWRVVGDAVEVETSRGTRAAARLVLCPGAWAAGLLRLPGMSFTVLRKSQFWFDPAGGPLGAAAATLPCFGFDTPAGFFYGFPALDSRGVKLAEHTGGTPVADPLAVDRGIDPGDEASIARFRGRHLPALGDGRTAHEVCLYTMSPDGHFVVGAHPAHPQVAVAAGFSGHGFKFASVIGEVLADLTLTGRTRHPIGFLAPTRFAAAGPAA